MTTEEFRESLLRVMEAKEHWAWESFTTGRVAFASLHIHFEQEYATYVRDFAVLVGRAYVQCPVAEVRAELAENVYEEETGGLSGGIPHAQLFLDYPRGLGMDLSRFEQIRLLPAARAYRALLDELTREHGWEVAAAITTLFLEGTKYDRGEIDDDAPKRPEPPLEDHPLVKHYGLSLECLGLTKAHRQVEGGHRASAWKILSEHVDEDAHEAVLRAMERTLEAWLQYRDEVAYACGLRQEVLETG
jgi:pyrroloquinoline-quinone synthase